MFSGVALSLGGTLLLFRLVKTRDLAGIRSGFRVFGPVAKLIAPTFGVGIVLGLAAVWLGNFNFLATWLVGAYIMSVLAAVLGKVTEGWAEKVGRLAAAESGDAPGPELQAALDDHKRILMVRRFDALMVAAIVALMVYRPNLW